MKEQLISFETAKLAKEKGFYEKTPKRYIFRYAEHEDDDYVASLTNDPLSCDIPAPTQSLLQKWLRETYNIDVSPHIIRLDDDLNIFIYYPTILTNKKGMSWENIWEGTYEQALEKGLQEALKLI